MLHTVRVQVESGARVERQRAVLRRAWFHRRRDSSIATEADRRAVFRRGKGARTGFATPESGKTAADRLRRLIHVASWANRFLFAGEQLNQPVGRLSGGERARVLIAKLMLQPADVLLLDEPTNDLDIPTLEVLEESLLEFRGALVLVTHDRYLLDRVSTTIVGLDGFGEAGRFADYSQWEAWQQEREIASKTLQKRLTAKPTRAPRKAQLL